MGSWDSQYYKRFSRCQGERAMAVVEAMRFRGDESVLDLGCGNGAVTRALAERVGYVMGLDLSEAMIAQARADYFGVENLEFVCGDASDFCFEQRFDLVVSFNALHWVRDHGAMLRCVRDVLKSGGRIVFLMCGGRKDMIPYIEVMNRKRWKGHVSGLLELSERLPSMDYHELLSGGGFVEEEVTHREDEHVFARIEDLVDHIMTSLPAGVDLSRERCLELAWELAESFAKHSPEGTLIYKVPIIFVRAHI